uniref:Uncharacterized protein n=1 Tax=Ciona savignyi TaxID=51511 RepID=H2Z6D9_CIOSA
MNFVCFIVVIIATQCNGYNDLYDISQFLEQWDANRLLSTYDCSYCRRMDKLESSETEHNLSRTKRDVESNEPLLSSVRLEDEDANFDLFQEDEQTSQKAKNDFFDRMIGLSHLPDSSSEKENDAGKDNSRQKRNVETNSKKVARFLRSYQYNLDKWRRIDGLATFAREANITKHNTAVHTKTSLEFTKWLLKKQKIAAKFSLRGLSCDQTRMIKSIRKSSSCKEPALRKEKVRKRNRITAIYSKAKVCRPNEPTKCLMYEPGIINLFAKSRNYGELLWAW